jgi:hypothetical protein
VSSQWKNVANPEFYERSSAKIGCRRIKKSKPPVLFLAAGVESIAAL